LSLVQIENVCASHLIKSRCFFVSNILLIKVKLEVGYKKEQDKDEGTDWERGWLKQREL